MAEDVIEIAPGLHALGQKRGGRVHAFLAESDGGELTLIDTMWEADGRRVLAAIDRLGRRPSDRKRIALTHGHRSHLGGAAALREQARAQTYAHPAEAGIVEGRQKAKRVPILRPVPLSLIPFRLGLALGLPKHPPCPVDEPLADGDAGWPDFQLDPAEHERSLRRLATFEPLVVGVGHGEPLADGTPDRVHAL